jgi:diguanylate cyclase (GGDEF)-like protein
MYIFYLPVPGWPERETRQTRRDMQNSKVLLETLMANTGEAILMVGADHRIAYVSKAFELGTGLPAHELLDQLAGRLDAASGLSALAGLIGEALASGEARQAMTALPGHAQPWEMRVEPVRENDRVAGCISILRPLPADPHEQRASVDALTRLPNRHLFLDRVGQAINVAQRGNKPLLIMQVGIDRFREITNVLGDNADTQLLQEITGRLLLCARTSDTLARVDEEHFAFLMQIAAVDDSVLLVEKVLAAFEKPFALNAHKDISLSCSIGASVYPNDAATPDELIKTATIALHHAEQGGRNRHQFFSSEMNLRARNRLEIESGIRRALARGEFVVYYQPKIHVGTRRVAGLEALIRWLDPERGLVPPGEFIPIAEESGLIEQIGQWVLEESCRQNRLWQAQGFPPVRASVNVSARQFRNRNFVASVADTLARTGLDPRWLELEITESMLMGDIAAIVARMEDLRRTGVSLSIDDFGTGYSSLSYLSRFPITTLKIDRAFIVDVQNNPHTAEIARAIIGLSRGLDLEVVAEGAEVSEQVDFLRDHGCDVVQGYFYSKPLPADEFAVLLRDGVAPH